MTTKYSTKPAPIGVFDSGFGGLSILREIRKTLPQYDYIFLGDNARAPYGNRSYQLVYEFTLQAVKHLFEQGCHLVILACNTASAKALRSIQQRDLANLDPSRRVLGVIRPTVEQIGKITTTRKVGIFGTPGTVQSLSYDIEIAKMHPDIKVFSHACPMWVPLVENRESDGPGADYFIKKDVEALMAQCSEIDSVILGCTHYPLLYDKIKKYAPTDVKIIEQGPIVAQSLKDYLERHPEMEQRCSKGGTCIYSTTEDASRFSPLASIFVNHTVNAQHVIL
ncbi:MAG: glutamate racemase [Muribaculaceae bacterium]|nr:glutamate racemase [Muribaculaceae bacterium]MBR6431460.1 glutamate racemase [Muribaculaceae bacterium]